MKPTSWLESVNCAIEGVLWAARTQRHMRYHFFAAVAVLLVALYLHISSVQFTVLVFAVILVLFAELINTAVEVVVDMVSPEFHPLAQRAKDVAAGAVLITSIGAVIIGYLALASDFFQAFGGILPAGAHPPGELAVASILAVILVVVLLKALWGKGTPLHGGMPSGHAAIAFSIATSIAISQAGPVLSLLAISMAGMVSHSRLLLKVHSIREIIFGAGLGAGVTLILHLLFA